ITPLGISQAVEVCEIIGISYYIPAALFKQVAQAARPLNGLMFQCGRWTYGVSEYLDILYIASGQGIDKQADQDGSGQLDKPVSEGREIGRQKYRVQHHEEDRREQQHEGNLVSECHGKCHPGEVEIVVRAGSVKGKE